MINTTSTAIERTKSRLGDSAEVWASMRHTIPEAAFSRPDGRRETPENQVTSRYEKTHSRRDRR